LSEESSNEGWIINHISGSDFESFPTTKVFKNGNHAGPIFRALKKRFVVEFHVSRD
jgi:hypothetical protein